MCLRLISINKVIHFFNVLCYTFIPKSFSVLSPFGRFIEIGKVDLLRDTAVIKVHFDGDKQPGHFEGGASEG